MDDFEKGVAAYRFGNYPEAVCLFLKAAAKEDAHAQYNLGVMYKEGKGVDHPDDSKAKHWWRKAAKHDLAEAQFNLKAESYLGVIYDKNRDNVRSYILLTVASALGDRDAKESQQEVEKLLTEQQIVDAQERVMLLVEFHKEQNQQARS